MAAKRSKTTPAPAALHGEALALHDQLVREFSFEDAAALATLRQLCETLARLREVQGVIGADGLVVVGVSGQRRAHPLLGTEDMLRRSLLAHARALRITAPEA